MTSLMKLESMLKMQQRLNDETNGKGWEKGFSKEGKIISWRRCIYMECAELMDSFAWKHWKDIKSEPNWENVKIELVDIWHFILSMLLENPRCLDHCASSCECEKNYSLLAQDISCIKSYKSFILEQGRVSNHDFHSLLGDIELIIHKCSGFGSSEGDILNVYFMLCAKCALGLDELYEIYLGKNLLNIFRQENGYKEGLYRKTWLYEGQEREDNEVLSALIAQGLEPSLLKEKMTAIYKGEPK